LNDGFFINLDKMCSNKNAPRIMVFRPTWKEFQNFSSYIELMESQGAHKAGVAKVCYESIAFYIMIF